MKRLGGVFRAALFVALLTPATVALAERMYVEVIGLKYRTTEEIIPALAPLVAEGGSVTGYHNQLILKSTAANLAEVRQVLNHLDTPPRRLMLHVRHARDRAALEQDLSASAAVRIGSRARVSVGDNPPDEGVEARISRITTTGNESGSQQIQTLEGRPAFIQSGKRVPVAQTFQDAYGHTVTTITQQDAMRGFYVTARLVGQGEVLLDISTQLNRVIGAGGSIEVNETQSSVSGRIGEWLPLGGTSGQDRVDEKGLLRRYHSTAEETLDIWVRVEALD